MKKMLIMDGEQKESFEKEAQIMSLELMDKFVYCFLVGTSRRNMYWYIIYVQWTLTQSILSQCERSTGLF